MTSLTLADLNEMEEACFVAALGHLFEHSPWVASDAAAKRPFASVEELHGAFVAAVAEAGFDAQLALINAHPDLAGKLALAKQLTAESAFEQASAGLDQLSREEFTKFTALNDAYREKFGFPFIICVRLNTKDSILAAFERRLARDATTERNEALTQIGEITRLRLAELHIA